MSFPEFGSVLFIEDDPDAQAAVRFALQDMHQVHLRICSSGHEGLQAAADFPADLLLLDVMMPEIDGASVLAGLRQLAIHRDTPAIFLTSLVDPEDMRYYRSLGVAGVIAKPFDPLILGDQIAAMLRDAATRETVLPPMTEELGALQRVFERELPLRLMRIRDALARCRHPGPVTRSDCVQVWELLDDLRNSANTYGHREIAERAQSIEQTAANLVLSASRSSGDLLKLEMDLLGWAL